MKGHNWSLVSFFFWDCLAITWLRISWSQSLGHEYPHVWAIYRPVFFAHGPLQQLHTGGHPVNCTWPQIVLTAPSKFLFNSSTAFSDIPSSAWPQVVLAEETSQILLCPFFIQASFTRGCKLLQYMKRLLTLDVFFPCSYSRLQRVHSKSENH